MESFIEQNEVSQEFSLHYGDKECVFMCIKTILKKASFFSVENVLDYCFLLFSSC